MRARRNLRWPALALLGLAAAPAIAAAQTSPLAVGVVSAERRPWLRIGPVLDDRELEDAVRQGLPLRIRIRAELWRDGLIDDLVGSEAWSIVLLYDPLDRQFVMRPRATARARFFSTYATARAAIESEYRLQLQPPRPGRYYYAATLEVQTLSASDLEELERWLQGELQPAVSGERSLADAVGAGARRLLIRLLGLPTRREEARSPRFRVEG